jgi:hypothetical protein
MSEMAFFPRFRTSSEAAIGVLAVAGFQPPDTGG